MEQIAEFIHNHKEKKHGLISGIKDDFLGSYGRYQDEFLPKIKGIIHNSGSTAVNAMNTMMTPEVFMFAGTALMLLTMLSGDKRKKRSAGQKEPQPLVVPSASAEHFAKIMSMLDENDCISSAFCESAYKNPDNRGERETAILTALGVKLGGAAMPWKETESGSSKFQYAEYVGYTSKQLNKEDGCKKAFTKCNVPPKILVDMIEQKYNVCDALSGKVDFKL